MARALERRDDVTGARLDVTRGEIELDAAENDTLPRLDLDAAVGLTGLSGDGRPVDFGGTRVTPAFDGSFGDSYDELASGDFVDWSVALSLTLPLTTDVADHRRDVAEVGLTQARRALDRTAEDAALGVRAAHEDARTEAERVETAAVVLEKAARNLQAEARRYQLGASRTDDVIRKILSYGDALSALVGARTGYAAARARLAEATAEPVTTPAR